METFLKVFPVLEDGRFQPEAPRTPELFSVAIVYEDFDGLIPAKEMAMHLLTVAKPECEISCRSWQFDFLRNKMLRQEALTVASQADMVIIAANGKAEFPAHVKKWLEDWLLQKKSGCADLLVLLDQLPQTEGEASRPLAFLRWIGEARQVDFCQATGQQTTGHSIHFSNQPSDARAYRGWSINH